MYNRGYYRYPYGGFYGRPAAPRRRRTYRRAAPRRRAAPATRSYSRPAAPRSSGGSRWLSTLSKAAKVVPGIVSTAGKALLGSGPASIIGAGIQGGLAKKAFSAINSIFGSGDYKVSSNSLVGMGPMKDSLPQFISHGRGQRVIHREMLMNVFTSATAGAFKVDKVAIQPAYSFPWLSTVAQQYQEYRINGMIFEFKSTSSDALNSVNTALGDVVLSTFYNVNSADPVNQQQMYQTEFTTSCKPSCSIMHAIECARSESPVVVLNTRNGNAATVANQDLRLYDFANFYIASSGNQGTSVLIGQLWCSYDITLLKPWVGNTADVADHWQIATQVSPGQYFGSTRPALPTPTSDLGSRLISDDTVQIPESFTGALAMIYFVSTNSYQSISGVTFVGGGGCSPLNLAGPTSSQNFNETVANGNGTSLGGNGYVIYSYWTVVNGGTIQFTSGAFSGNGNGGDLMLISLPASLAS